MFVRVLWGSLRHQRSRMASAALALLLGASLFSALINLSFQMAGQTGRQLRSYGANLLLVPRSQAAASSAWMAGLETGEWEPGIPENDLKSLETIPEVAAYSPYLYLTAEVAGQRLVLAGVDFTRIHTSSPWWKVTGDWPSRSEEALLGAGAAQALGLEAGERFTVRYGESKLELALIGTVETGGPEESQLFISLPLVQALSGRPGQVGLVQVGAVTGGRSLEKIRAQIAEKLPGVQVRTLSQIARAEELVQGKVRLLIGLVAALVLIVAFLTVGSATLTSVLERRSEIGLMRALGAKDRQVAAFFLCESVSLGAFSGLTGYAAGLGVAALIGRQVFQAELSPDPWALPATIAVTLAVGVLASLWPVKRALAVDPAVALRGE